MTSSPIVDFATLKTELGNYLWNRSDVTAELPTFIALAEAQMNRKLHTRLGETRTSFTISAETMPLPTDFNGAISFLLTNADGSVTEIYFLTPDALNLRQTGQTSSVTSGTPDSFTVEGGNFRFYPFPNQNYTANLTYRQKITALTASNTTNWVITNHPDAYLYGSLREAYAWLRDLEKAAAAKQIFDEIIDEMEFESYAFESLATNLTPSPGNTVI